MKSYFILNYDVTDKDTFGKYGPAVKPILAKLVKAGVAKVLINDSFFDKKAIEGNPRQTFVLVEFENITVAKQFYESKEYQDIIGLRTEASEGWAVIL